MYKTGKIINKTSTIIINNIDKLYTLPNFFKTSLPDDYNL